MFHAETMVARSVDPSVKPGAIAESLAPLPRPVEARSSSRSRDARLREIVEGHFEFIWRTLRGLGVPASSVDDATQQVFWTASRKLDSIAVGSERAFLFATAKGVASNVRRSCARNREDADESALESQIDASADPEQAVASRQARELLERVLERMPEELRVAFVLFELEGTTMAAMSELLSVPMGTVASRLRRAREWFDRATTELQEGRRGEDAP